VLDRLDECILKKLREIVAENEKAIGMKEMMQYCKNFKNIYATNEREIKLEILQSLGGLYDGLAFYALHWSYTPSL